MTKKNNYKIVKIRNGCWKLFVNDKEFSEHSFKQGAIAMMERLQKSNPTQ